MVEASQAATAPWMVEGAPQAAAALWVAGLGPLPPLGKLAVAGLVPRWRMLREGVGEVLRGATRRR